MELSGHPTQDLLEELIARGTIPIDGDRDGPSADGLALVPPGDGAWLWVPARVFETGLDDRPTSR
jgi:hypothetical protein